MSVTLILAALWAIAATAVAMLPMRFQYVPGVALLIAAPVLILAMGWTHGILIGLIGLLGFVSMFRNPLRYFWRRFRGEQPEVPQ